jgi:hypothetical protein
MPWTLPHGYPVRAAEKAAGAPQTAVFADTPLPLDFSGFPWYNVNRETARQG